MRIRCPHCHAPIELVNDGMSLSGLTCDSCGNRFGLAEDETTETYSPGKDAMVGHFELLDLVGTGHFGTVWKAHDSELDRVVAVKIPRKSQLDAIHTEQFMREARAAAQLRHEGIVTVHEIGRDEDCVYIVSDFVDGADLKQWISAKRLTPREAAELLLRIAEALSHAHSEGVIHRDLKPSNIILDSGGRPHIADFGIAKRESDEITMTVEGHILGTPAYMSPEQAAGRPHDADARSDVYALGVVFYELLTGERPFRGDTRMLLLQIVDQDPAHPRTLNSRISRDLETICLKCLEKSPERRYQTAYALAAELRRYLAGKPIEARPAGTIERGWRWCKRNPWLAGSTATALALLTTVAVGSTLAAFTINAARDEAVAQRLRSEAALEREAKERERAEAAERSATQTVDDYFTLISENTLFDAPGMESVRRDLLEQALARHRQYLAERAPTPELRAKVAASFLRMALAYQVVGLPEDAVDALSEGVAVLDELTADGHDLAEFSTLSRGVFKVPYFRYRDIRRPSAPKIARDNLNRLLTLWSELAEKHPHIDAYRQDMAGFHYSMGMVRGATLDYKGAIESFEQSRSILEALSAAHPDSQRIRDQQTVTIGSIGRLVANVDPKRAAEIYRQGIEQNPTHPGLYNSLSWLLVTHADTSFHNPPEAVALAQKANELEPRDWNYWNGLGVALYRAGSYEDALEALQESMNRHQGGDRYDWVFMAMAYWKLGNRDEALRWFERIKKPMDSPDKMFTRFCAEATALMGEPSL